MASENAPRQKANPEPLSVINRTHADKSPVAENTSVFSLRQNWHHLTHRPPHQESVIDGVRALAILWVVLLHTVFFNSPASRHRS